MKDMEEMCQKIAIGAAYLSEREARTVLQQRVIPKMAYKMQLSSFNQQQCGETNAPIERNILPKFWLKRNMHNDVIYSPIEDGGMEIVESYSLQDQL